MSSIETQIQSQTYWCHLCDMSIHLFSNTPDLCCPECSHNCLELMDPLPPSSDSSSFLLLDDTHFIQLYNCLNPPTDKDDDLASLPLHDMHSCLPTTIKITSLLPQLDPLLLCAVCKDQFVLDSEAKQLPCNTCSTLPAFSPGSPSTLHVFSVASPFPHHLSVVTVRRRWRCRLMRAFGRGGCCGWMTDSHSCY